jgi:ketosteroid isomerase-like protein
LAKLATDGLADIEAIKQLKARYFRLLDTKDWAGFPGLFTIDAEVDVSEDAGDAGRVSGRDRIAAFVERAVEGTRTVHHGHMPEIELTGVETARGVWAMFDCVEFANGSGQRGYGHYFERYVKEDGVWRIAALRLTRLRVERFAAEADRGGER